MSSKIDRFHELHRAGCFVIPNPWDLGSARILGTLGFQAMATTSSGFAWTLGRRDNQVTLEEALAHLRTMAAAIEVPLNADFEGGFAVDPEGVARNVTAACATGIAGLSIEDSVKDGTGLYDFDLAVARVRAARAAIDKTGSRVVLTARTEFVGGDMSDRLKRLRAFAAEGADCLFAPGLKSIDEVRQVVDAVKPKPVNVLVGSDFTTVAELKAAGVRRISVGGALARTGWGAVIAAATEIAQNGTFAGLARAIPGADLQKRFF